MMDDVAENSLSIQLENLTNARKNHAAELAQRQTELHNLEEQLTKERQGKSQMIVSINKLLSEICVLEEEGCKRKLHVMDLEKEISRAIEECEDIKSKLTQMEKEQADLNHRVSHYTKKMELHHCKIRVHEKEFPALKDLDSARQHVKDLKTKKEMLKNKERDILKQFGAQGKTSAEIKKDMAKCESDVEEQRVFVQALQSEVEDIEAEKNKTEMSNAILKKKNGALLTCLKRQADEQKEKYQKLSSCIGNTVDEIAAMKAKLDKGVQKKTY